MRQNDIKNIENTLENLIEAHIPDAHFKQACLYSCMAGGKRLRPLLTLEFSRLFGGIDDYALRIGAAIELIHCYSLIHDDLPAMDNDDIRRGKPTLHKKYNEATAILVGDALLTLAFEILSDATTHPSADTRCQMIHYLAKAAGSSGMVGGQYADMGLSPFYSPDNHKDILRMQAGKTGALITASCVLGMFASGITEKALMSQVVQYGNLIGTAFQLQDDLLDIQSETSILGKQTGKDSANGKATLPHIWGIPKTEDYLADLIRQADDILKTFSGDIKPLQDLTQFVKIRHY